MVARRLIRPRQAANGTPSPVSEGADGFYFASEKQNIQFIRSGCTLLDCVLGGGWPLGRVVNIVGDKSTGKTLLAMEAIANFYRQYPKGRVWYNEAEAAFDADYAKALGIPFDDVTFIEDCDTVEGLFKSINSIVKPEKYVDGSKAPGLYIMDSLDSLSDAAEKDRGFDEATYGGTKAKQLSHFFRVITQDLKRTNVCLMIISQVRDNIGAMFGEKHTRSGGRALDFYASQILWLAHTGILKRTIAKQERAVGVKIKAKCKKNKVGLAFRECNFEITFGYGIEDEKASQAFLTDVGLHTAAKATGDQLRVAAMSKWFDIEKTFLPERRKYGAE